MSTSQRTVTPCCWGVKTGVVVRVWVAGNLCDPLVTHHIWAISRCNLLHDKALYKFTLLCLLHLFIGAVLFSGRRTKGDGVWATDLYRYSPDAVPPIHAVSYHVSTDQPPPPKKKMATSSGLFLATIYNHSQLAERKHVARYWSINTAATAVPFGAHPSPLVITMKLAAAILGRGCTAEVFCRPSTAPVGLGPENLWFFFVWKWQWCILL